MSASKGYIPRTFLQRLGVSKTRPAWFVLFLAAVTTAGIWAGALILFLLLARLFLGNGLGPISSWGPLNWLGGFLLLWDMAVLWYHVVYLIGHRLDGWDEGHTVEHRLELWGSPLFMLLAATARLLWLAMKYVAAPMLPFLLAATFRQTTGIEDAPVDLLCMAVLIYPVIVLLVYVARFLVVRAKRASGKA